ncbi:trypsin I-P1 [Drosophila willistoni]|uniref:trypsin I-P1 n=1 Tax=Drosophila willistoni TaxID=7260 RepID=UPI000C26D612|nr:trypsin I-P1 [Drosophila willistoni]
MFFWWSKVLVASLLIALAHGVSTATIESDTQTVKIEPKIVGGHDITIGQAAYTVSVRLTANDKRSFGSGHLCGGVVISQRLVATAAHCCVNSATGKYRTAGEYVLVMGSTYLRSSDSNTQSYYLQELIVHAEYNHSSLTNDIALMFINGYIPWNSNTVKALPLNTVALSSGTSCVVTGWGLLTEGGTASSNTLQLATVPIVSYTQCQIGYTTVPRSQVCAGYMTGGIDACQGDSGGPLACNDQLVGIVSYGYGCANIGFPGVYTNVSYYHSWIVEQNSTLNYTLYKNTGMPLMAGSTVVIMCLISLLIALMAH